MKTIFGAITILVSFSAIAAPIKTCKTTLTMPESDPVPTSISIEEVNGKLEATTTQKIEGQVVTTKESAEVSEFDVRAGLTKDTDPETLNPGEGLIVHAMVMESDPVFQGAFKAGLSLKKVRSAKVFVIGETTNMGSMSIIEAKDEKGKNLGSFIGGFLVAPCK